MKKGACPETGTWAKASFLLLLSCSIFPVVFPIPGDSSLPSSFTRENSLLKIPFTDTPRSENFQFSRHLLNFAKLTTKLTGTDVWIYYRCSLNIPENVWKLTFHHYPWIFLTSPLHQCWHCMNCSGSTKKMDSLMPSAKFLSGNHTKDKETRPAGRGWETPTNNSIAKL